MILFKNLRLYNQISTSLGFPIQKDKYFILFYYPENNTLLENYHTMGLRQIDFRNVIIPITTIPRSRLIQSQKKLYKNINLYSFQSNQKFPAKKNLIFDYSNFLNSIDMTFKPTNYRQRAGFLIKNLFLMSVNNFPDTYHKILLYNVDLEKPFDNSFTNRKAFPIFQQLKDNECPFDSILMSATSNNITYYRLVMKDKNFNFQRTIQLMKSVKHEDVSDIDKEEESNITIATNRVVNALSDTLGDKKQKVVAAVSNFLTDSPEDLNKISTDNVSKDDLEKLMIASVLYKTSGDLIKSKKIAKSIPSNKNLIAIQKINNQLLDEMLPPKQTRILTKDVITQSSNIDKVNKKTPEHIFEKRKIDYEINLQKDMANAFKMLENKEVPLKVDNVKIIEIPDKVGEIDPSDKSIVEVSLKDVNNKPHKVKIEVPRIDPKTGTFRVYGQKKCLINQIIQCPITFPEPSESRFESSYSKFRIWVAKTKKYTYLHSYMGGCKIPLLVLLSYSFGFDYIMKQYEISYEIKDVKPRKDEKYITAIGNGKYIYFKKIDSKLKEYLVNSILYLKIEDLKTKYEFGSKMYFNDIIISMTGRINSTYLITSNIENIVTPVASQILFNQQLPTKLDQIMRYMALGCIDGKEIKRNDLSNQRIRNSEVIVDLAQSRILAAYTQYKEQILSGNKDAIFDIPSNIVLSDFNKLENVSTMEYANPIEEMSTLTRISPIGKAVGGIPDKRAISADALTVHKTYFGNIDLYDTPEGENIGINQQLTINAKITSARGMFQPTDVNNSENSGLLSTTTSMIPFISNNDGNRIMMAANQAKQMLPLKNPEPPAVQTGYESILTNVLSDSFVKRSPCIGKVLEVNKDSITIICKAGKRNTVDISPVHLKSGSGKDTLSVFNPIVIKGETIKEGDIIAEGSCISGGTISLGRSLLAGIMPYRGYNYEDGITINERLVSQNKLNSLHGIIEEVVISEKDRLLYIANIGDNHKKGEIILRKSAGEIEEFLGIDEEDESTDILAGQLIKKSPGGTIVDIEVFSNMDENKFPQLKGLIERTKKRYNNTLKPFLLRGRSIEGILIKFKIEQELIIGLGDKLANRHGNKGIISLIEKDENMPRTPWGDTLDIVLNPLGILSRMNVGQVYELYCGLIAKELSKRIIALKRPEAIKLFSSIFSTLDATKNKKYSSDFIKNLQGLNNAKYELLINQIKNRGFVPIIVPSFQTPSYKHIISAMKLLNLKSGYKLYLPDYNTKTHYDVPVGYMYITKLEHMGNEKLHARSTGPVTSKTLQPVSGKKREGGQRLGEMDTYSYLSYNATLTLSELMGPLSDDHITKNEMISEIIQTGKAEFRPTKSSPAKDLLNAYMIAMMLSK